MFPTRGLQVFATMSAHVLDFQNLELLNEVLERRQTEKKKKRKEKKPQSVHQKMHPLKGKGST